MNLLEALGLDPERFTWRDLGLCTTVEDPEIFFDKYEADKTVARQADQMCLHCPVMKQCAEYAMSTNQQGLWGGVYWAGNGKPDANRNEHKTDEVWNMIRERMTE